MNLRLMSVISIIRICINYVNSEEDVSGVSE
jgi:hypothetical protein